MLSEILKLVHKYGPYVLASKFQTPFKQSALKQMCRKFFSATTSRFHYRRKNKRKLMKLRVWGKN